jgi:phage portal protein BeeE
MNLSLNLGKFTLQLGTRNSQPAIARSGALSPAQTWLRGDDSCATPLLVSPYQQSVWVYTAVSALAQTISSIPFRISRGDRSGENLVTHGPVVDLFNRPHPTLNRFRFWESIVTWYCLRGEIFLVALDKSDTILPIKHPSLSSSNEERVGVRSRSSSNAGPVPASPRLRVSASSPSSLLVLHPDNFRHLVQEHELVGWKFIGSPTATPLPSFDFLPEEVIHDFLPNPHLYWRGMSPLSVALLAAQTDFASAHFMKGLMLNNADAGVIVRTEQQLSPEQREQMLAVLRERKASAGTADRPLLLWGTTEVIRPTLSSADLQFMENRKMNRQEICAAFFRIPQSLVGFSEDANRSIAQAERLNFIENSITPLCTRLEAALEPVVKSFGTDLVGWFDLDSIPIMQQARRERVDTAVKLFALGYPPNAINKSLDLGLPHLPWGNKGYLPHGLQQAGEAPEPGIKL